MLGFRYQEAQASNELVGDNLRQEKFNKGRILFVFSWRIFEDQSLRETIIKDLIKEGVFVLLPLSARESLKSGYLCIYPVPEAAICFAAGSWFCFGNSLPGLDVPPWFLY